LAQLEMVRIIHGKGTGALRKGVHEFLKEQPNVREVRTASRSDGGQGATEVFFSLQ
jgi:DNA mismatch repair protein MutS2